MIVKLLTEHRLEFIRLKGGCTGSSESKLVKMPHCWKSHVPALMSALSCRSLLISDGKIRSREDLDYEKLINQYHTTTFTAQVSCYDGRAWSQKKTINIQVTNENEPPFFDGDKNYFIETDEGAVSITNTSVVRPK